MKARFLIYFIFTMCLLPYAVSAADDKLVSCGAGYILEKGDQISGIDSYECKKLWCMDLENGKIMGTGDKASSGYVATKNPVILESIDGKKIECFGTRKWCSGQTTGEFNIEYGAYTKKGDDSNAYVSQQKGDCFVWSVEKPVCNSGESVVMTDGKWVCAKVSLDNESIRKSSVRRIGTIKKM